MTRTDYNELGQAISQHLHSTDEGDTFLQDISYAYNERGMMIKNSAPLFAEQLKYNDGTTPQYNGNVANQLWGTPNSLSNTFTYDYDKVNRLTNGSSSTMAETGIQYDLAGNIQSLTRDSHTISYSYNNNQLSSVSGTGVQSGTYTYDGNGNVVNDGSNGYTFTNNMLNLPRLIKSGTDSISYAYDATGDKLSKSSTATGLTEYVNGIQYGSNTGSYGIDFVTIPGGRAERKSDGTYRYEYDLTDHLGNARVTIQQNPTTLAAEVIQQDDYYPFGLRHSLSAGDNQYLYNGKEVQPELNQYDYGARFYNPAIGRWNGVDQLAEMGPDGSPYNYVVNNPIAYIDPDGRWKFDADGNIVLEEGDNEMTLDTFLDENWLDDTDILKAYGTTDNWDGDLGTFDKDDPYGDGTNIRYIQAGTFKRKSPPPPLILPTVPSGGGYTPIPYGGDNGSINFPSNGGTGGSAGGAGGAGGGGAGGGSVKQGGTPGWRPFVAAGVNPIRPGTTFSYPVNGGAASDPIFGEAAEGYILTRYGGTRPNSEYFSPRGTTIGQRYLLKGTNTEIYEEFEILKPFGLQQTQIAGQNGVPTGGIQLRSSMPAGQLLEGEYIVPVETPVAPVEIPELFFIP